MGRQGPGLLMSGGNTVLVLGGGVGGLVTARELRKRLPREDRVVLVDRERRHVYSPSLLWLVVGDREANSIQRPLGRLRRKGIDVVFGEIQEIDLEALRVTVSGNAMRADRLVVSLGAELAPEVVPGLAEAGHEFYTLSGAEALRSALRAHSRGRIVVLTAGPVYKCPAAPYEAAMLIEAQLRERGLRDAVTIEVYAAEPAPMGVAGPEVSEAVRELLRSRDIPYHPGRQVTAVDPVAKRLAFADGSHADYDLLAYVPPHRAPRVVRDGPLAGDAGWISVNRHTMETSFPGVHAIGDVVSIPLALGKALPKAGVFAHREAEVVARNIAAALAGGPAPERFDGHGECFLEIGDGKAGFASGDFYAEPKPAIRLRAPGRRWHLGKVLLEKTWLYGKI